MALGLLPALGHSSEEMHRLQAAAPAIRASGSQGRRLLVDFLRSRSCRRNAEGSGNARKSPSGIDREAFSSHARARAPAGDGPAPGSLLPAGDVNVRTSSRSAEQRRSPTFERFQARSSGSLRQTKPIPDHRSARWRGPRRIAAPGSNEEAAAAPESLVRPGTTSKNMQNIVLPGVGLVGGESLRAEDSLFAQIVSFHQGVNRFAPVPARSCRAARRSTRGARCTAPVCSRAIRCPCLRPLNIERVDRVAGCRCAAAYMPCPWRMRRLRPSARAVPVRRGLIVPRNTPATQLTSVAATAADDMRDDRHHGEGRGDSGWRKIRKPIAMPIRGARRGSPAPAKKPTPSASPAPDATRRRLIRAAAARRWYSRADKNWCTNRDHNL